MPSPPRRPRVLHPKGRDDRTIRARSVLKPQHPFDRRASADRNVHRAALIRRAASVSLSLSEHCFTRKHYLCHSLPCHLLPIVCVLPLAARRQASIRRRCKERRPWAMTAVYRRVIWRHIPGHQFNGILPAYYLPG